MSEDYYKSSDNSRDGYKSQGGANGGGRYEGGRPSRPRFNRGTSPARSSYGQRSEGGYTPRYNSDNSRSYQNRYEGGYRPRYTAPREEGTVYSQGGNNHWDGKSRYAQGDRTMGGYGRQQGAGYRPRYNQGSNYGNEGGSGYRSSNYQQGNGGYRSNGGGFYRAGASNGAGSSYSRQPQRRGAYDPHAKYSQKKRLEYKEENYDPTVPMRLNKFLANAGVCSRRDADKYIEAGVVSVNGVVVTELGTKVLRTDEVKFHDNAVTIEKKVYVLLNKPKGYVTTSDDPQNRKTVMDLVKNACPERIYPVGRLDRNTTGVLLLTNDGELASKLTHPKFLKKKIYHVTTDQNVSAADIRQIAEGITLEDGEIKADAIEYASPTDKKQVGIEIHSGKNRIVRRIFESLGYHVVKLDRVYFAGLTKKNVRRGDWRYLTEKEVQMLRMGAFE